MIRISCPFTTMTHYQYVLWLKFDLWPSVLGYKFQTVSWRFAFSTIINVREPDSARFPYRSLGRKDIFGDFWYHQGGHVQAGKHAKTAPVMFIAILKSYIHTKYLSCSLSLFFFLAWEQNTLCLVMLTKWEKKKTRTNFMANSWDFIF